MSGSGFRPVAAHPDYVLNRIQVSMRPGEYNGRLNSSPGCGLLGAHIGDRFILRYAAEAASLNNAIVIDVKSLDARRRSERNFGGRVVGVAHPGVSQRG